MQTSDSLVIAEISKAMGFNGCSTNSLAKICMSRVDLELVRVGPLIMFSSYFFPTVLTQSPKLSVNGT